MPRNTRFAFGAMALFAILFATEVLRSNEPFDLINFAANAFEMALLAGAVAMTAFVSVESRDMRRERSELSDDLARARKESARFRDAARAHVDGLSRAIAAQFREWGVTDAESDVATLMLKGLSHKEIATIRDCSEATVRQHAATVYRKANLTGRAQLTAYFLEDLLMPQAERPPEVPALSVVATPKTY